MRDAKEVILIPPAADDNRGQARDQEPPGVPSTTKLPVVMLNRMKQGETFAALGKGNENSRDKRECNAY